MLTRPLTFPPLLLAASFTLLIAACGTDRPDSIAPQDDGALSSMQRLDEFLAANPIDKSAPGWRTRLPLPPLLEFDPDEEVLWRLETTHGELTFRLMPDVAPMHVSSTLFLTRIGFYDELTFHRIIPGFMAQGGDPLGNGRGGPGYEYAGEFDTTVGHDRPGLLSMANRGPHTDGSQFFVTFGPAPHLDGKHTIFGELMDLSLIHI